MSNDWQRLSPWAIVFFAFRGLKHIANLYPAFIGVFITAQHFDLGWGAIALYTFYAFVVLVLGASLYYLNFFYIQQGDKFLIRSGILQKDRLELPFARIQNITVKEPFYFRPLGLVILNMDSAGSAQKEVGIAALSLAKAATIKDTIEQYNAARSSEAEMSDTTANTETDKVDPSTKTLLITRSNADIVLHGITHNRAWLLLAFMAPFFEQIQTLLFHVIEAIGFDFATWISNKSVFVITMLFIVSAFFVFFVMSLLSVLGSILSLYDFKLYAGKNVYQRNSGLLNKHEIQVKKSRVQALRYVQNWMDRIVGRLVLILEPFNASSGQPAASIMQKILVPSINDTEFDGLAKHVYPTFALQKDTFKPISKYYLVRKLYMVVLPLFAATAAVAIVSKQYELLVFTPLVFLLMPLFYCRWRRYGWMQCDDYLVVRSGFIGVEYFVFPRYKVQQVKVYQSIFLKRKKLASVQFVLASRAAFIPFMGEQDAHALANNTLYEVEVSGRSWM
ncbi:PH domain-containing protein [Saccharophagus degradans]|uniref:PH domain-containing protein n=2 Tax=Gammaproteobacteria TaxID=1236 RepID=A0AAW7X274_9GAMM|nr:PH domain-containing protein [Saccharophagus degradans]MDO6421592.1 PH domain-containing protein [Saccharophagus degradans]MDO6608554.1 PH domain-containing protein [Saccharophagus degradans]